MVRSIVDLLEVLQDILIKRRTEEADTANVGHFTLTMRGLKMVSKSQVASSLLTADSAGVTGCRKLSTFTAIVFIGFENVCTAMILI